MELPITYIMLSGPLERINFFMDIRCVLQEKESKAGNKYLCLFIPDLEKTVFLEPAEIKLLKLIYKEK